MSTNLYPLTVSNNFNWNVVVLTDLILFLLIKSTSSLRYAIIYNYLIKINKYTSGCTIPVCKLFTADTNDIMPKIWSIDIDNGYC